tara:strand:- start:302 stop:979 length:678 start_codon:yes stop_codon:yes gene_type:complete
LAKRLTEKQKKEIIQSFKEGKTIDDLSEQYNCTKLTIIRNLKKNLGESNYKVLINKNKSFKQHRNFDGNDKIKDMDLILESSNNNFIENKTSDFNQHEATSLPVSEFIEISPVDVEIDNSSRKELSSVDINEIVFPKVVYMIVDKNIELEIKLLKNFPAWEFLPAEDLNRKTIEIYFDLKNAKRSCNKEKKVIKVPNTDVFKIVSPILVSRGISRIVSEDKLIAL